MRRVTLKIKISYKINAFRVAEVLGISRAESLRAFLFATRLGLFDLNWDVHCPSCTGIPAYHKHLMDLSNKAHCAFCAIDWDLDFESQVEVTFTVNPAVRSIRYSDFSERDFNSKMRWFNEVLSREKRLWKIGVCINPRETETYRSTFAAGKYLYWVPSHLEHSGTLVVEGPPAENDQQLHLVVGKDGTFTPTCLKACPGTVELTVTSEYPELNGFLVASNEERKNWVSAAHVTMLQDFRDLFSGEFLSPGTRFAIRSVTLLFTDIKGSTELYEHLGDAAAYSLVQEHFKVMTDVIRTHGGNIVKTIGDAVMAAFPDNAAAVKTACEIQTAFRSLSGKLEGITVKIGLHRGPAIAVTSNRRLDYFGRVTGQLL